MAADIPNSVEPPTDNLVRGIFPGELELRQTDSEPPIMEVGFARYDEWTEISSAYEGNFMERVAPGAFTKTILENSSNMRALFNHGNDPQIGNKVLGPIKQIRDTEAGPVGDVELLDTSYNRDLIPGLRAKVYGSSFRFRVMKEEYVPRAEVSDHNPKGLPERTIQEARVMEFGPVTFPAYQGATAGIRSLTDDFMFSHSTRESEPEPASETTLTNEAEVEITTTANEEPTHSPEASRDTPSTDERPHESVYSPGKSAMTAMQEAVDAEFPTNAREKEKGMSIDEMQERQKEIKSRLDEIAAEFSGMVLDTSARAEWDGLVGEREQLAANCKAEEERRAYLDEISRDDRNIDAPRDTGTYVTKRDGKNKTPDNAFDLLEYHSRARDHGQLMELYTDGAKRAVESFKYPHERADEAKVSTHIERLLESTDGPDRSFARRVLSCGSPTYRRAFWKTVKGDSLTSDEQRAMAQADMETRTEAMGLLTGGGIAPVPIQIDPTIVLTSNGVLNPIRQLARVVNTTSFIWQGVTSAGAVAQYQAEAAVAINNAGSLVAPQIQPERVTSFIPYSWELAQDWGALESELAQQIQDAKDTLEATKFSLGAGHGSNEPRGILIGAGTVVATSNGTTGTGFALSDVYLVEAALPPRYMANASWAASPAVFQKVRQFAAAAGPGAWAESLIVGNPPTLLGYPAYKCSTIGTSIGAGLVAGAIWGVLGDWSRYVITDRLGMGIRVIPNLFGGTAGVHFPTGQSGLYAYWRNSADVIDSNAFRVGTISKGVN